MYFERILNVKYIKYNRPEPNIKKINNSNKIFIALEEV